MQWYSQLTVPFLRKTSKVIGARKNVVDVVAASSPVGIAAFVLPPIPERSVSPLLNKSALQVSLTTCMDLVSMVLAKSNRTSGRMDPALSHKVWAIEPKISQYGPGDNQSDL